MPLLILLGMLIVLFVISSKENKDTRSVNNRVTDWRIEYKSWCDRTVDPFLKKEVERYILSKENEDEVSALWAELAEVAPELDECWPVLYDSQFANDVPEKVRSLAIGYNLMFLTPFVLAKNGKSLDIDGITFKHRILINHGTNREIKRTKDAPWGLSDKSIINLNKWLEETLISKGISDARIVFLYDSVTQDKSIIGGNFYWLKACPVPSMAVYKWQR